MKVVINKCYGGFGLSEEAKEWLRKDRGWLEIDENSLAMGFRTHPDLIAVVERLGKRANEKYANLKIVEVPEGVSCQIERYDGQEWVAELHRTWD